jgi:CTP:molybdopterin cytidylyltransferase MocA
MTTCGVVLAGGAGRRFGGAKQLARLDGRPLLQHAVDAACAAGALDRVVVVLGAAAPDIAGAVAFGRAEVVVCEDWEEGLAASLRCGVAAAGMADWVVVTLGDEPALPAAALARVVATAHAAAASVGAVRAVWDGRPGHPVALRSAVAARAAQLRGDVGARALLGDTTVLEVECADLGAPVDVDTPADLDAVRGAGIALDRRSRPG